MTIGQKVLVKDCGMKGGVGRVIGIGKGVFANRILVAYDQGGQTEVGRHLVEELIDSGCG